ncbi:glycoside hydrolase family 16 protein [Sphingobium sp. CECT 9361]|uniref:glycoside hydrolase family 16 protein n=1 Tax=Sphingobium sp. CECT 9361 TaxID=2845384 RepID=UPI001E2B5D89|nr:glycoside hydrolase family 16 protein [Sphingobium sp. CECT 9361]CAH0355303.1 hypothetical protein SPH9361_03380 [Sphingobium sp. CECT 9361]
MTLRRFAFAAIVLWSPSPAQALPPEARKAGFSKLVFSDDFSVLDLSPDGGGNHRWFNGLWQRGPVNPKQFELMNGFVRLKTHVEPRRIVMTTALTTMPRTKGSSTTFRYGYFEARLRFSPGPYAWPAFWLLSEQRPKIDDKAMKSRWCEIDIFEGGRATHFQGTVHDWRDFKSTSNANQHFLLPAPIDKSQWNNYGMLWTPRTISWFFNGRLLGSAPTPVVCKQQSLFIIIGAQKRQNGPAQEVLDVDWVHVYR